MFDMTHPARIEVDARETSEIQLDQIAVRCLRAAAKNDHSLANKLTHRSYGERKVNHNRRAGHLNAIGARSEARASDLAKETR